VYCPEGQKLLKPSSGFTQGDVNSSKLFTCNTASLVAGLQLAGGADATVVAIVDDITIMGTLAALVTVDEARENLQKPSNYLVNLTKQYVYTMNESHVPVIQEALPSHKVIYIGGTNGFTLSGIPLGSEQFISAALQNNVNKTKNILQTSPNSKMYKRNSFYSCSAFQEEYNTYWLQCPCTYHGILRANMTKQ